VQHTENPFTWDAEFFADPVGAYAQLRTEGPVHRAVAPDGSPVWLVTRYADVRAALTDPRLSIDKANATTGYQGFSLPPALDANLGNIDPPEHTRLRRIMGKAFTPRRVEQLRPRVQAIADELLDGIAPLGHADLVATYTGPLPITVICELLGIPTEARPDFRSWTDAMLAPDHPDQARDAVANLYRFLLDLIARKRERPADDLLTALIEARDDQDKLSEDELLSAAFVILFGGYDNTVNLLGNALVALLSHPDALATVRAAPEHLPTAVEELLRFDPPSTLALRRFPLEDITIDGVTIPAGHTVMLSLASANRDGDQFVDPDTLQLDRTDNSHLSLGHGAHFCLGASLARLEAEIGIETVLRRLPNLALDTSPEQLQWRPSWRSHGPRELPVSF
jgi:cytochrome P450